MGEPVLSMVLESVDVGPSSMGLWEALRDLHLRDR